MKEGTLARRIADVKKQALRTKLLDLRKARRSDRADGEIAQRFLASPLAELGSYFVYCSYGSEADTRELIGELFAQGKTVCLPKTFGREMRSVRYENGAPLERDGHNILSPKGSEERTCEVSLTPLLGFDGEGGRLGYGGGFYDRYFGLHPQVLRVGLAYSFQQVKRIPVSDGDFPLDAVVTEKDIFFFGDRLRIDR